MIGVAKVETNGQGLFDAFIIVKFGSVIDGYGFDWMPGAAKELNHSFGDSFSGLVFEFTDGEVSCFTLNQSEKAMFCASGSHNGIGFPVSKVFPRSYGGWPFIDTAFSS
jgi:hypothetical protein